ncbi:hypothetical protein L1D31_00765 [Vibrio sp. Isolate23]|uniref:hypothetical protein n=1 Tax=Vibrio sp. Isolate23 TaxID=2908533 RepID=UPI001EFED403|nr:hypothetical protein [Vibrio sp. Isolate23]MCG9681085.1 hypothetical protein [Vibrio sp. Isolate23]
MDKFLYLGEYILSIETFIEESLTVKHHKWHENLLHVILIGRWLRMDSWRDGNEKLLVKQCRMLNKKASHIIRNWLLERVMVKTINMFLAYQ